MVKKKSKIEIEMKTSIKSYKHGIESEKRKMLDYSRKFGTTVRSLQADFKKHQKDLRKAASDMREEGISHMNAKVRKFRGDIKDQIKENKESVAHMENNVKYFLGEINKKARGFRSYARGPFQDYIKAFWGTE